MGGRGSSSGMSGKSGKGGGMNNSNNDLLHDGHLPGDVFFSKEQQKLEKMRAQLENMRKQTKQAREDLTQSYMKTKGLSRSEAEKRVNDVVNKPSVGTSNKAKKPKNSQIPKADKTTRISTLQKQARKIVENNWADVYKGVGAPKTKSEALHRFDSLLSAQSKTNLIKFVNSNRKYYNNK